MSYHKNMTGDDLHKTKINGISGGPNGVITPEFIGEMIVDIDTEVLYTAIGLGINDWKGIGGIGGTPNLGDLADVDKTARANLTFPSWNSTTEKYEHVIHESTSVIYVDVLGSDIEGTGAIEHPYLTITKALSVITDNSSTVRYTIMAAPGLYTIDNSSGPLQLKKFCNITAPGIRSAVFQAQDPDQDMFLGDNFVRLVNIVFSNTGGTGYILRHEVSGNAQMTDCAFRDCSNGCISTHADGVLELQRLAINNPAGSTTNYGIKIEAGLASLDSVILRTGSRITTGISISGAGTQVSIHGLIAISPNIDIAIECLDGSKTIGVGNAIGFCTDGLVISGDNTEVEFDAFKIEDCTNDGFRIENSGSGIRLALFATTVTRCGGLNFNILNPNSITLGNGYSEIKNSYIVAGAKFYTYILDVSEDDEGLNIFGELHVGSPARPAESVFGGGDSYTNGMVIYTKTIGGSFVDVSTAAKSASGSTFTFTELGAGAAIYIASDLYADSTFLKHFGIKTKLALPRIGGVIVAEYWNGTIWEGVNCMEADSDGDYYPHAKNYFQGTEGYHIRYDAKLSVDSWALLDPMLSGTERYWIRFRIDSAVSQAPVFEQFKLHTSRYEINADGWVEYFGRARPIGQLPLTLAAAKPFEGNMQNQTIYINENLGVGYQVNKFTAITDKMGVAGFLPFNADTSTPIKLQWAGLASISHTIEWTIRLGWITQGGNYYTSSPGALPGEVSTIISRAIISDVMEMFEAELDVSEMISRREGGFGDELWISLQPTTLTGTFALTSSQVLYTKWCEGGHV